MDLFNFIPKLENAHQTGISSKNIGGYKPSLIEPGMQSYIKGTLKNCKNYKNQYSNFMFNIIMCIGFFLLFGVILYVKFKGKITKKERQKKNRDKQYYILSKLQKLKDIQSSPNGNMITNLPNWNDHPEREILEKFR